MQTPPAAEAVSSYITPIGYSSTADCGYCRRSRSGYSYYASATFLTPQFYQALIDRCWRRSGTLLYRPNQKDSCCPHYTLRLDSTHFKPSKDQRQAINRFNKYVAGETYTKEAARLHPLCRRDAKKRDNEFNLVQRVHEAEHGQLRSPPDPAHRFTVTLEQDVFTEEKYAVFENYQRNVHKDSPDNITRDGFKRFLCDSPLSRETLAGPSGEERQLGSFHQCYRLDGRLVAIGVLDLLPNCVSAVYFLYHESIQMHSPGKLGALREIALAAEKGCRWWYSGYYIHSCPKMRYKIDYSLQYVLDPETLDWDILDEGALAVFDRKPYVSLSRERHAVGSADAEEARETELLYGPHGPHGPKEECHPDDSKEAEEETSLLRSSMPGIPSFEEMLEVDMDSILVLSDFSPRMFHTRELVVWDTETIDEFGSLKCRIAELVAALGPDLAKEICIDFRRRRVRS